MLAKTAKVFYSIVLVYEIVKVFCCHTFPFHVTTCCDFAVLFRI